MEPLKSKRKGLRTSFTTCVNKIEAECAKSDADLKQIAVWQVQLKDKFRRVEEIQKEIEDALLKIEDAGKEYEDDFNVAETYRDRYFETIAKIEHLLSQIKLPRDEEEKRKFKLPKLELRKFNGEPKEYLGFWSQFSKIHEDPDIPNEDKFQYLLQAVTPKSKAARLLESFPPTAQNYPKAIDQLRERFGREDLLVQIYVRDLLSMVMKNAVSNRTKADLAILYDELECKLRALDSLGRTQEKYGDFLTPLVESCLPENILLTWERQRSAEDLGQRSLEKLMKFLQKEVQGQEMVVLARTGFGANQKKESTPGNVEMSTTSALVSTANENNRQGKRFLHCLFCDGRHPTQDCFSAKKMSVEDKRNILFKKGACFSCMKLGHTSRFCKFKTKCVICDKNHNILMCSDREKVSKNENKSDTVSTKVLTNSCKVENVFLMTLVVNIKAQNKEQKLRAILDTGSQRSYLSSRVIQNLKLKPKKQISIIHGLFGGRETEPRLHDVYDIKIDNEKNNFSCEIEVLSENKICGFVPKVTDIMTVLELHEKGIKLSDFEIPECEIDLLLGSDVVGTLFTGKSINLESGLVVLETRLGYTLIGKEKLSDDYDYNSGSVISALTLHVNNSSLRELWDLESLGILDPVENVKKNVEYSETVEQFKNSLKLLPDGRYELGLPFKLAPTDLPTNQELTWNRHLRMCKRAQNLNFLNEYQAIFQEWENLGIIEKVPQNEIEHNMQCHYLPHRPVIKTESMTTKVRPVFDASAKEHGKFSLNEFLFKGPNLLELIPDIIDRFRTYPIGLSADIEKAFLQLGITPEHRDFLRFFYPSDSEKIVYRHCRVVFGVSSSPFLLAASISHLLDNNPLECYEITQRLKSSFYVDNCVTGVTDIKEAENFILKAREVLKYGCFNLRGWESNIKSQYISKSSGITNVLGILWDLDEDTLKCNINLYSPKVNEKFTKRSVLSTVQKIFDPIGLLSPATLPIKIMLQETWKSKIGWDTPIPNDLQKGFKKWLGEISMLKDVKIIRYTEINSSSEMHVFVDASKSAYAVCIFLRTVTSMGVKVYLLRAKSRVAPLKQMTIPRLELMACCIGVRLANSVRTALDLPHMETTYWSDSMVALWWIRQHGDWSVFVANRVKEINQLGHSPNWRHVPGNLNPADILSRGCSPRRLCESQWWEGPQWLKESHENWPFNELLCPSPEVDLETKKVRLCNLNVLQGDPPWYCARFSNFQSIIRLVAWILRFVNNVRQDCRFRKSGELSLEEMEFAEKTLIRIEQFQFFPEPKSIPIVNTFKDEEGIIRVRTRITERIDKPSFISPVLLPDKSIFSQRLIEHFHQAHCHAGTQILLSILREKFWILRGRKTVRSVLRNCIKCKRYNTKSFTSYPVSLPADRVKDASVFEVVGIDLAGPLYVKHGDKVWIVLFTCGIYRAIHLELISSLSTEAFLLSLRRFIARRGRPRTIYSDNGTNFRGAFNELRKLDWDKITHETSLQRITWKFNPPTAAWWGGWWERLVRVVKDLLKRTLGKAVLTYEELLTILCDCESVINSRPLTYLSEDPTDLSPITPGMFLLEGSNTAVADVDLVEAKHFRMRIRYRAKLIEELRSRFRKEYLSQLFQRQNQNPGSPTVKLGDIVLIGDDVKKRLNWPLAKVIQLIPGKDGKVRTVKLKTQFGVLLRPVQRVFTLELQSVETDDLQVEVTRPEVIESDALPTVQDVKTSGSITAPDTPFRSQPTVSRAGRVVKIPKRLDLLLTSKVLSQHPTTQKGEDVASIL